MICRSLFIAFVLLFANKLVAADSIYVASIEQTIQAEKYTNTLKQLTIALKRPSALSADTLSYYLYLTTDCLFTLRNLKNLEIILNLCASNEHILNTYYLTKIDIIKANYWKEKGEIKKSETLLQSILSKNKERDIQADAMLSIASLNLMKENVFEAETLYGNVFYTAIDTLQKASALNGIGACFTYACKYDSARIYYLKALAVFQNKLGNVHTKTAQVKFNLAIIANKYGDYTLAEHLLQETLNSYLLKFGEKHTKTAEAYGTLGDTYLFEDNLEKAFFYITKERDIILQLYGNQHTSLAYSYLNIGRIYALQNNQTNAEIQFKKGIDLLTSLQTTDGNLFTDLTIEYAKIKSIKKDFKTSNALAEKLLQNKNLDDDYKADILLLLGENKLAQNENAMNYFVEANKLYKKVFGEKNIYSIDALIGLSNCYLKDNHSYDAITITNKALALTLSNQKIIFPYDHWECMVQLIKCKKQLNINQQQSLQTTINDIELIKKALQEANRIKQTYFTNGSQLYYAEKMAELNQLGIYFLTHFYKKTDNYFINNILYFSENNKANLLRNKIINTASNQVLPAEEQSICATIVNKLNYFVSLNENQEKTAFNINDSIFYYQNKYELFTKQIEENYPKIYHLKYGESPLTVGETQKQLPNDYTFLTYLNDGENYYCLSISKSNITYKIVGNTHKIDQLIQQQRNNILLKQINTNISRQLFNYLLPKKLTTNLIIAADAMIHQVAFDAITSDLSKKSYLIYNHAIQYAFSANTYFNHQEPIENKNIVAFYPDFTNSIYPVLNNQKEHQSLKIFSGYNVFYQKNATVENFKTYTNSTGIIHIATHLIIDTTIPLKSYLVFQPSKTKAYTLSINDIWKLNTDCQLITLASCQSNFGKQQNGEGIQNFAWAFHYAGARNILSTQWDAADKSTATVISYFYKNLRNGKNKQQALQLAKLNYLNNADAIGAEPYFWANYSLFADATPILVAPSFLSTYWWFPILLLSIVFVLLLTYKKVYLKYYAG